ncbi:hypothetical protein AQUSIP_09360 [Aquicella siphonis]|uniref:Uncharacterized protein n=1 Tax=Aquicella siphonis TaxID=254247 RepID=A0A5E4PH12_9COXI|nr:hypothetical protein [Aquicella siphonis]VVC75646.1 hypothetical protein AQUSIP_09360 [Aquicella siphonis]
MWLQIRNLFFIASVTGIILQAWQLYIGGFTLSENFSFIIGYGIGFGLVTTIICSLIVGIPASIYWLISKNTLPGAVTLLWLLWIALAVTVALILFGKLNITL